MSQLSYLLQSTKIAGRHKNDENAVDQFHKACKSGDLEYVKDVLRSSFKDKVIDSTNTPVSL